ncbi:hypothetical protein AV521_08525 [Streptomyces sp. IMTB 2501]|uniref:DUF2630 family protein n=1 Tax=Streptomyces sp. IMTB 2501 TaxID=1776340 RepID=UPI00096D1CF8|nr:DUF2630 family protein [Streptomyces sp. IMTB 2501]OLZ71983.1 hypothetical protein AV521_08525 [Streptomyces sp. IMTB 2501]
MDQDQDQRILSRITEMVEDERRLREALASGRIDSPTEQERLGELERELARCWDLLRQRRAKTEFGGNPDEAQVRSATQVEGYRG